MTVDTNKRSAKNCTTSQQAHDSCCLSSISLKAGPSKASGCQIVTMVQATEPWHGYNFTSRDWILRDFTASRSFFLQSKMRPVVVVVADVFTHQALEMAFVQDDHMVEQVSTAVSYPAFGDTILPWAAKAGSLGLDAEALHGVDNLL